MAVSIALNISMTEYCVHVNDKTPLFVQDYQFPHHPERMYYNVDVSVINPYWTALLEAHNLFVARVDFFYGPPNSPYAHNIHLDHAPGDRAKLNWVFGGEGSVMHWYTVKKEKPKELLRTPGVKSSYHLFEPSEVEVAHSDSINNPSVVQVGVPHNVESPGAERWCYSLVVFDSRTKTNAKFDQLKKVFYP